MPIITAILTGGNAVNKNFQNFSAEDAKRLAQSPAGQQLIALLQQKDNGQIHQAMQKAADGDYSQASQILSSLLSNPETMRLLSQLGGK